MAALPPVPHEGDQAVPRQALQQGLRLARLESTGAELVRDEEWDGRRAGEGRILIRWHDDHAEPVGPLAVRPRGVRQPTARERATGVGPLGIDPAGTFNLQERTGHSSGLLERAHIECRAARAAVATCLHPVPRALHLSR